MGEHTITSGIEGAWVNTPTEWSENYFRLLLDYDMSWSARRRVPSSGSRSTRSPRTWPRTRTIRRKLVPTMMTTADMALKVDPDSASSARSSAATTKRSRTPSPAPGSS
jgi:catalase-peroxidase